MLVKCVEKFGVGVEWTGGSAGFKVRDALGDSPIDEGLRLEDDPPPLHRGLQNISDSHADLLPHVPGDYYLILVLYGDDVHRS